MLNIPTPEEFTLLEKLGTKELSLYVGDVIDNKEKLKEKIKSFFINYAMWRYNIDPKNRKDFHPVFFTSNNVFNALVFYFDSENSLKLDLSENKTYQRNLDNYSSDLAIWVYSRKKGK